MTKKFTILFLLAIAMLSVLNAEAQHRAVTITGFCYLEGQTNHSGISVLFEAVSPSAVTTEVFTQFDGAFTAGLTEGIYTVEYSKQGYVNQILPGTYSFFENDTLPDITLPEGFFGTIEVFGPQSGVWESGYLVKVFGDVTVAANDTLWIQPGVTVRFMGYYKLEVSGTLLAVGAEGDSIVFTSGQAMLAPGNWQTINFRNASSSGSMVSYAVIEYGQDGFFCQSQASPMISDNLIRRHSQYGIYCSDSYPNIQQNQISYNISHGIYCSTSSPTIQQNQINNNHYGIFCSGSSPTILQNQISYNNSNGIYCNSSSPTIQQNQISYNNHNGIFCQYSSSLTILQNQISYNNSNGIYCSVSSSPTIRNNTIGQNNGAGVGTESNSNPQVLDNIIEGNLQGVSLSSLPQTLTYNLFWNNTTLSVGSVPPAFGNIVTQNANGDPCDTYLNLFMDPEFVQYPLEGNYSWVVGGDSVTFMLGYRKFQAEPYLIRVRDFVGVSSVWINMDWNGEFYLKKLPLNFPQNIPIQRVEMSGVSPFYPSLSSNPIGPAFEPGIFIGDFNLLSTSPCIDAGNPDAAYYDPDGTIADIGAYYFDQGSAAPVISDFTGTPQSGRSPLVVEFTQDIAGPVTSYLWSFSDGTTSNLANPVKVFTEMGKVSVSLLVEGPGGSDMMVKNDYITVNAPLPPLNPLFSAAPLLGYTPLEVQFTNESTGPWQTVLWEFGDGAASAEHNPLHTYQQPGEYTVSLSITTLTTTKTLVKENYIHAVTPQEVVAMFEVSGENGAAPFTVAFFNQSFGSVDSLLWDFGDNGATSTLANPIYTFNLPGEYVVSLTAFGPLNSNTTEKTILVEASAPIITQITDRPNDQGGYVYLQFKKSFYDNVIPNRSTESYTIQRQDNGVWVSLNSVLAYGEQLYTVEAATLLDSTSTNNGMTTFRVIAGMSEGTWISESAQGYSVDNLAPAAPQVLEYTLSDNQLSFAWNQNPAYDFNYFAVYRSDESGNFGTTPYATLTGTSFTESISDDEAWFYTVTAFDDAGNESAPSEEISTLRQMQITLPAGWTGISGYLNVWDPMVETMFDPIVDDLVILYNESGMYWPGQNINTLVNWEHTSGYKIKLTQPTNITLKGLRLTDRSLPLNGGWNLIPVLSECEVNVEELFAGKDLVIIKEAAGGKLYWPQMGVNTLETLQPGQSYDVLTGSDLEILSPACE